MRIVVLLCLTIPLLATATDSEKKISLKEKISCFLYAHTMPIAGVSCGLGICSASVMDWLITNRSIRRALSKRIHSSPQNLGSLPSESPAAPAPTSPPAGEILCESMQRPSQLAPPLLSPDPALTTRGNDPQFFADQVALTKRLHRENRSSFQIGLLIGGSIIAASLLYLLYEHLTQRSPEAEQPETC